MQQPMPEAPPTEQEEWGGAAAQPWSAAAIASLPMAGAAGGASACSTRSWPCSASFLRLTPLYARGRRNALDLEAGRAGVRLRRACRRRSTAIASCMSATPISTSCRRSPTSRAAARRHRGRPAGADRRRPRLRALRQPVGRAAGARAGRRDGCATGAGRLGNHDPVEMVEALRAAGLRDPGQPLGRCCTRGGDSCASPASTTSTPSIRRGARGAGRRRLKGSASPWCTRPRWPTTPPRRASRSISAATPMAARSACRAAGSCSPSSSAAATRRAACGGRAGWSATPRRALACRGPTVRFNTRGEAVVITLRCAPAA